MRRPHLCGLTLLLQLLQLLGGDEADRLVPGHELGACRHGGQDDVPPKAAEATHGATRTHTHNTSRPESMGLRLPVRLAAILI